MLDATAAKAGNIPVGSQMAAGYCDGPNRWTDAQWARLAGSVLVRIATIASTDDGHVLDVETGDATPAQAPYWALLRRRSGAVPTIYCNLSTQPAVIAAFRRAAVAPPLYFVAHYDEVPELLPGAIAKQFTDNPPANPYDSSVVADFWPGVDSPPAPPAEEESMILEVAAGAFAAIGSPDQLTDWNVTALDGDTSVAVFAYGLDGSPLAETGPSAVTGNHPNVKGPSQVYGNAGADLHVTGPCTLGFEAGVGGGIRVVLH